MIKSIIIYDMCGCVILRTTKPNQIWSNIKFIRFKNVHDYFVFGAIRLLRNTVGVRLSDFTGEKRYGSTLLVLRGGGWVSNVQENGVT